MSLALWLLGLAVLAWPASGWPASGWPASGWPASGWPARSRRRPPVDDRTLPGVLDLVAVALRSGAAPGSALAAAAVAADPPLRAVLAEVGGQLSLGVEPARAWSAAGTTPTLAAVAVLAGRSGSSGARLADALAATAVTLREDALVTGRRAAGRVGVWSVLPLGLCFLPAFVLLGVVPAVVGLLGGTGLPAP